MRMVTFGSIGQEKKPAPALVVQAIENKSGAFCLLRLHHSHFYSTARVCTKTFKMTTPFSQIGGVRVGGDGFIAINAS
jgi:hypothetical protein